MEPRLLSVGIVPLGLVSSTLLYASGGVQHGDECPSPKANEVMLAQCPTGRLLAFVTSFKAQFTVFDGPISHDGGGRFYKTCYEGLLFVTRDANKPRPQATALIVLPFVLDPSDPQDVHSVVVAGFSDGYVRIYSKSGTQILAQPLHSEPVAKIVCTPASVTPSKHQHSLVVLFKSAVCIVDGQSCVNAIRSAIAARKQEGEQREDQSFLNYKKWHLQDQSSTADVALLAPHTSSIFEHLCEASTVGGVDTIIKTTPSPVSRLIAVGEQPMIALYRITKDAGSLNMSDVVSAVASKMTSAVLGKLSQAGGWLGWGGGKPSNSIPAQGSKSPEDIAVSLVNLPMSTNVPDQRRSVGSIVISPLGNLAALVDGFGRVLVMDVESLAVRRMWKGYREAQCGWLLVERGHSREKRITEASRAQCLCIYSTLRGIVELWPAQKGPKVAAFNIGKGCRLLYAPYGVFGASENGGGLKKGVADTTLLLCPDGQVVTFSVPFSSLIGFQDNQAHDADLLQELPEAVQSGNMDTALQLVSNMKSLTLQSVKEAIAHALSSRSKDTLDMVMKLVDLCLSKLTFDPAHRELWYYLWGVKQLAQMFSTLKKLSATARISAKPPSNDNLEKLLVQLCNIPTSLAANSATVLKGYFASPVVPQKRASKAMEFKGFLEHFDLSQATDLFSSGTTDASKPAADKPRVCVKLNTELTEETLLDLGNVIFMPLLTRDCSSEYLGELFRESPIPCGTLLSLLCRMFLQGGLFESSADELLQHLQAVVSSLLLSRGSRSEDEEVDPWQDSFLLCASSCNTGYALLYALVAQSFATDNSREGWDVGDMEDWETVVVERERWVRLAQHLEPLTMLYVVVGSEVMKTLPLVPYMEQSQEDEDPVRVPGIVVHFLNDEEKGSVYAALLESTGTAIIAHCVSQWLVMRDIPAETVAKISMDPSGVQDSACAEVVTRLSPLLHLFPSTLSTTSLLLYCTWHQAHLWSTAVNPQKSVCKQVLDFLSHLPEIVLVRGMATLLWDVIFEPLMVHLLNSLKKDSANDSRTLGLVYICRNLFGYLYQIMHIKQKDTPFSEMFPVGDIITLAQPSGKGFLPMIVHSFPRLNSVPVKTYFELTLLMELSLCQLSAINMVSFFPTWLKTALKKGLLRTTAIQEQIPVQLCQKRTKFLCDAVRVLVDSSPKMLPSVPCLCVQQFIGDGMVSNVELAEYSDFVFLLSKLWDVDIDAVKLHWVTNLFAAGLVDQGKQVFLSATDKTKLSPDLLSLAGCLADLLLQNMEVKSDQLALLSQLPPSFLEWLRKQSASSTNKSCMKIEPSWKALSQLLLLIQPYLFHSVSFSSLAKELDNLVQANLATHS